MRWAGLSDALAAERNRRLSSFQIAGLELHSACYRVSGRHRGKQLAMVCGTRCEAENDRAYLLGLGYHNVRIKEIA